MPLRNRKESFTSECEQEIKDILENYVKKKFSMIYQVQFHNVQPSDIMNKIVSFKFDKQQQQKQQQSYLADQKPANPSYTGVSVTLLKEMLKNCSVNDEFTFSDMKLIVKEKVSIYHCVVDIEYQDSGQNSCTYPEVLISYVEVNNRGNITLFPLEDLENGQKSDVCSSEALPNLSVQEFLIVSQALVVVQETLVDTPKAQPILGKQPSFSTNVSSSNLTKGSGASLINIKGSGASIISEVKGSGASLSNMQYLQTSSSTNNQQHTMPESQQLKMPQQHASVHKKSADFNTSAQADEDTKQLAAAGSSLQKIASQRNVLHQLHHGPEDDINKSSLSVEGCAAIYDSQERILDESSDAYITVKLVEDESLLKLVL